MARNLYVIINDVMKKTSFDANENLDPYQNGQSDAEKLMRRHLQTPGDIITDDDLNKLRATPAETEQENNRISDKEIEKEDTGAQKIVPWDVIGE